MTRFRLTARAQMHGEVREPGYIFTLAEGEVGPHKPVTHGAVDVLHGGASVRDEPLYVPLSPDEERAIEDAEQAKIAEANAAAEQHSGTAEQQPGAAPQTEAEQTGPDSDAV